MATRSQNQVVHLTRCLDVPGHTAMLVRVMVESGYRWYPEYTVEEKFRDFNQSQYLCTVRIYPSYPGATEPLHCSYGLGVTLEMSVQDAAYSMMTICHTLASSSIRVCIMFNFFLNLKWGKHKRLI